jgi:hypothetical protein
VVKAGAPTSSAKAPLLWVRLLVGIFLTQLIGAQLWPTLHHAVFAHAVCAEHGELVHVVDHQTHASPLAASSRAAWEDAGEPDEHDHCGLPPGTHDQASEAANAVSVEEAALAVAAEAFVPSYELSRSIPILALAPKLSPPS